MRLLEYVVRDDWRELTQRTVEENTTLWRGLQVLVLLSTLASAAVSFVNPIEPWKDILYTILSSCPFISFALWTAFRRERWSHVYAGAVTLLLVGSASLGGSVRPGPGRPEGMMGHLLPVGGGIAMLVSWAVVVWSYRQHPVEAEKLGITPKRGVIDALTGTIVGATVGAHLLLAAYYGGLARGRPPTWTTLVWQICFWAGLRVLGEELLLRGLGFGLLREGLGRSFWATAASLTALSLITYVVVGSPSLNEAIGGWIFLYVVGIAAINAALREWRRSLIPCLACSIAFNTVMLVGLGSVP